MKNYRAYLVKSRMPRRTINVIRREGGVYFIRFDNFSVVIMKLEGAMLREDQYEKL